MNSETTCQNNETNQICATPHKYWAATCNYCTKEPQLLIDIALGITEIKTNFINCSSVDIPGPMNPVNFGHMISRGQETYPQTEQIGRKDSTYPIIALDSNKPPAHAL